MIHEEIECPVYNESVLFYADCTPRQVKAHLKKNYDITDADLQFKKGDVGVMHNGDEHFVLWCRESDDIPTLVHELYHLCVKIFDSKGIPLSIENDEAMAYYLSYWMTQLLPLVRQQMD